MKLTARTVPTAIRVALLCMIVGTLAWEITERVASLFGATISLTVGPVGFDLRVIAVSVLANPGTLLGAIVAFLIIRRL